MTIKELRNKMGITQVEAVKLTGIPLRTFKLYENDESRIGTIKYNYIIDVLKQNGEKRQRSKGFAPENIANIAEPILKEAKANFCILYGSYAVGTATEESKIKLIVSTPLSGIAFYKLESDLTEALGKEVDLLDADQLPYDQIILNQVLREGIRIYS